MAMRTHKQPLQEGDCLPRTRITLRGEDVDLHEYFQDRKGIIFGVTGAFTPIDTEVHFPGYIKHIEYFHSHVDFIGCVAVNDPFVMKAWARRLKAHDDITLIADVDGVLTRRFGMTMDVGELGLGRQLRCRRFAIIIGHGAEVRWVGLDDHAFVENVLDAMESLEDDSTAATSHADEAPHWDYRQQGADWTGNVNVVSCKLCTRQSPIALREWEVADGNPSMNVFLDYQGRVASKFKIHNNGHSIQVSPVQGEMGSVVVDDVVYEVKQFHFHAPSEHTFSSKPGDRVGERRALELHIVHTSSMGDNVVVGLTFVVGAADPLLAAVIANVPATGAMKTLSLQKEVPVEAFKLANLFLSREITKDQNGLKGVSLAPPMSFYRYNGSLTTPPCSENVTWFVARRPLTASHSQLAFFTHCFAYEGTLGNYRELQNVEVEHNTERVFRVSGSVSRLLI